MQYLNGAWDQAFIVKAEVLFLFSFDDVTFDPPQLTVPVHYFRNLISHCGWTPPSLRQPFQQVDETLMRMCSRQSNTNGVQRVL